MTKNSLLKDEFQKIDIYFIDEYCSKLAIGFPRPIQDVILIDKNGDGWLGKEGSTRSGLMWRHSLYWVGSFLKNEYDKSFEPFIFSTINSYLRRKDNIGYVPITGIPSADHAASFRVTAITLWWLEYGPKRKELEDRVETALIEECRFLLDPVIEQRNLNNHAIMSLMAVANFISVFGEHGSDLTWNFLLENFLKVCGFIFDKDGFSNENTVGYHGFNWRLIKEFRDFVVSVRGQSFDELDELISKSENVFRTLIWQSGDVPPIGDSQCYKSGLKSLNESIYLPDSGLALFKNELNYLSLICGFRYFSHKHVDDTSITFRFDGVDYLTDSGYYNYDSKSPIRNFVVSSKAHSGVFPLWLDEVDKSQYSGSSGRLKAVGEVKEFRSSRQGCFMLCRNSIQAPDLGRFSVNRMIYSDGLGRIVIADEVEFTDYSWCSGNRVVTRIVLNPGFSLSAFDFDKNEYALTEFTSSKDHRIRFLSSSPSINISKGYVSYQKGASLNNQILNVYSSGGGVSMHSISVGQNDCIRDCFGEHNFKTICRHYSELLAINPEKKGKA